MNGLYIVQNDYGQLEHDNMAERSKAVRSGRIPKGREFESHCCHQILFSFQSWLDAFCSACEALAMLGVFQAMAREVGEQCGVYKGFSLDSC